MSSRIILSADSTCDLGDELRARYDVQYYPFHVILDGRQYGDGVDLTPDRIYEVYRERKILPKTAAINAAEYTEYFSQWTSQGYEVIHLTLGSGLSAAYQNCRMAAESMTGVYAIDSRNLSTGSGLAVIEAAERIAAGMPAAQIAQEVQELTARCHASFVIDTLEFLHKGGRCSALARLGANLLQLKPCIEVNNADGTMSVGKKYRGSLDKALEQYVRDKLTGRGDLKNDRVFITHSGISEERIAMVRRLVEELADFREIFVTRAGCTISAHCGPGTLGVLFMTRQTEV
ncbi:MAG: DegV family protein [Clostridiales bacterium]|nr:DegV family protein [Clostridiales bacterium]